VCRGDPGRQAQKPRRALLAPTFDHASSLGRELTDGERAERLATRDRNRTVEHYALRKARGAIYRDAAATRALTPMDTFIQFGSVVPAAMDAWLQQVRTVQPAHLRSIVLHVPRMSDTARVFATRFLETTCLHLSSLTTP
jgi:hypothetical protein